MNSPEHLRKEDQVELNFEAKKENIHRDELKKIILSVIEENAEEKKFRKNFAYRTIYEYQSLFGGEKSNDKCFRYCIIMIEEIINIIEEEIRPGDKYYCEELKKHIENLKDEEEKSKAEIKEEKINPELQRIRKEIEESTKHLSDEDLDEILHRK